MASTPPSTLSLPRAHPETQPSGTLHQGQSPQRESVHHNGTTTGQRVVFAASKPGRLSTTTIASNGVSIPKKPMEKIPNEAVNWLVHGDATTAIEDATSLPAHYSFKVGIYGWRKRCLYLLILGLLVMVIVNLALTLWLLRVMEFSAEGMGQLRIVAGGVQLSGQALVLDALVASAIRSRRGQPLSLESSRNFTVNARGPDGRIEARLFLGNDHADCLSRSFRVTDPSGSTIFSADNRRVVVGADELRVTGEGGALFDGSIQTPLVQAVSGSELRLESPTRALEIRAPLGVAIESRAGAISATCLADLKLQSLAGTVRLDASSVYFPSLKKGVPLAAATAFHSRASGIHSTRPSPFAVYQLCVCSNGKLFLAAADGICVADEDGSDVCR